MADPIDVKRSEFTGLVNQIRDARAGYDRQINDLQQAVADQAATIEELTGRTDVRVLAAADPDPTEQSGVLFVRRAKAS